ncbi:MAG: class II aldolase/adducin family protein [Pseudomonadota bacterium]
MNHEAVRREIVEAARALVDKGLVTGTSGNISVRAGDAMLITPSGIAPDRLMPEDMVKVSLADGPETGDNPSSEWHFHRAILATRAEAQAVVHTHSPYATALSMTRRPIPASHYMVALFGGAEVRCSAYATFGTAELSDAALAALEGRNACLLANHGAITVGADLSRAMALAVELEGLARQHCIALSIGGPVLLSAAEMDAAIARFANYGPKD